MSSASLPPATGSGTVVFNRIRLRLPEMSETMSRIAMFLLAQPEAALELSIKELAGQTGTSPATVTRFCRLLDFTGYVPFRVSVATDLGRASAADSWKTDIGRAFGPEDSSADVLSTLVNAHTRSLQETASIMNLPLIEGISARIARSRHVDIYGVGGSANLAQEMQARLYRIGINSHHWSEVHAALTSAVLQTQDCVAIGISNTGRTEETVEMVRQAGSAGALTVAITNDAKSSLAKVADLAIVTSVYEKFLQPDDISAKHVQLLVLDLLYLLTAQQDFGRTTRNLAASATAVSTHRGSRPTYTQPLTKQSTGSKNARRTDV